MARSPGAFTKTISARARRRSSELGIQFLHPEALAAFEAAGQKVEGDLRQLRPDWILEQVAKAPPEFELQARNPERNIHIGGKHMASAPSTAARSCVRARAARGDVRRLREPGQARAAVPAARHAGRHDLRAERQAARLAPPRHDLRADRRSPTSRSWARSRQARTRSTRSRCAEMIFGARVARADARDDLADQRQLAAPLRRPHALRAARVRAANQALVITPFLLMGAMSPVSVAASLAQQMAEALAGIALVQTIRPGCPAVFGSFLSNTDMQSGSPSFGTPESAVGLLHRPDRAPLRAAVPRRRRAHLVADRRRAGGLRVDDDALADVPRRHELRHAFGGLARVGARLLLREVRRRRRAAAHAARSVQAARDRRGDAGVRRAPGGRARAATSSAPRTRSSASASASTGRSLLDRELRALDAERRQRCGRRARGLWKKTLEEYEEPAIEPDSKAELKAFVDRRRTELGD